MNVTTTWLSDYIDVDASIPELADALTMLGVEVESVDEIGSTFAGVVTARVEEIHSHPNADNLKLCEVNDGRTIHTIVCGAPNVKRGMISALAPAGIDLLAGKVRNVSIHGVKSSGMLVSKRELGLSEDHSGIYELPEDVPLGQELADAMDLRDTVWELSITPNRPDLLSVIGLAREVAAAFNTSLTKPDNPYEAVGGAIDDLASVHIEDPDLCYRYTGLLVKNVRIGPSPHWMSKRLEAVGVRSINNIVDITNFVQLECGQPLHAFDFDFLTGHQVIVRRCRPGEKITTLDEIERVLPEDALLICDKEKAVALAGIMGGLNSLVTETTQDVFIESAYFQPTNTRKTSRAVGLSSESSYRFERGVDIQGVVWGLHRCARLMADLCGGEIVPGYIDNYPTQIEPKVITLRPARVNQLLGIDIESKTMKGLLQSIELRVEKSQDELNVTVPEFRVDLEREVDLIEEVARLYGYGKILPTLPPALGTAPTVMDERRIEQATRDILVSLGLYETLNFAFTTAKRLDRFKAKKGRYMKVINPLSEEYGALRDTLMVGLCQNLATNVNRQAKHVALFEIRRVYLPSKGMNRLPDEPLHVGVILAGRCEVEGWAQRQTNVDFFDLKGIGEELFHQLGVADGVSWKQGESPFLNPDCRADVLYHGKPIGYAGKLSEATASSFGIGVETFVFEFDLNKLQKDALSFSTYKSPSKFPVTTRDLAIVVGRSVPAEKIRQTIWRVAPDLIKNVICFDNYSGEKIGKNEKSLAFSIRMQKDESEVSEQEAEGVVKKTLAVLMSRFEANLRE